MKRVKIEVAGDEIRLGHEKVGGKSWKCRRGDPDIFELSQSRSIELESEGDGGEGGLKEIDSLGQEAMN